MARKITSTKSAEERRAEAEELQATIATQVEALRESEAWAAFLNFAQSFHRYRTGRVGVFEPREYSLSGLPVGGVVRPRAASVRADADDGEWAQSEDAGEHRGRDLSGELLGCGQAQLPRLDVECSAQPVR
ncbi:hypothetical protein F1C12_22415 (plasmid) [Leifsonia shinshuensis]|uniref:Uncharacterized protein n=1 Tax=Leifsonia shinshuensis TaxID=150026 RepID=A0A7G6YHR8_9MICO|nr:hypothetical protein F1C12_22415 [Leifsonia shinshuensis]